MQSKCFEWNCHFQDMWLKKWVVICFMNIRTKAIASSWSQSLQDFECFHIETLSQVFRFKEVFSYDAQVIYRSQETMTLKEINIDKGK